VTYSPVEPANPREKAGLVLNLFDSRTGRKLRNFAGSAEDYAVGAAAGPAGALKWPVFQWAGGCGDRRAPAGRRRAAGAPRPWAGVVAGRRLLGRAFIAHRASGTLGRPATRPCVCGMPEACRSGQALGAGWGRARKCQPVCPVGLPRRPAQRGGGGGGADGAAPRVRAGTLRGWAAARSACMRRPRWACWTSAR